MDKTQNNFNETFSGENITINIKHVQTIKYSNHLNLYQSKIQLIFTLAIKFTMTL